MYNLKEANIAFSGILGHIPANERQAFRNAFYDDLGLSTATEAVNRAVPTNAAGRSALVEKLYKEVVNKKNIDFGEIPTSKGNIANFKYYEVMCDTMDTLNKLVGESANENMIRMNKLHEVIVSERENFETGFKLNIEIIMFTYCAMVEALIDIIQINIITSVNYLKDGHNITDTDPAIRSTKKPLQINRVCKEVDTFINLRSNGDWKRMVDSYKKNYTKNLIGEAVLITAGVIIGSVALLYMLRNLIFMYFYTAATIDEKCRDMIDYLKAVEPYESNEKARNKQQKAIGTLSAIAGHIETRILKETPKIENEIAKSDVMIAHNVTNPITETGSDNFTLDM